MKTKLKIHKHLNLIKKKGGGGGGRAGGRIVRTSDSRCVEN